jgi:hypothetical protein
MYKEYEKRAEGKPEQGMNFPYKHPGYPKREII